MKPLVILGWILLAGEVLFVANLLLMRNMGDDAAGRGLATAWGMILGAVVLVAGGAFIWGQFGGPRGAFYAGLLVLAGPLFLFGASLVKGGVRKMNRYAYAQSRVTFEDAKVSRLARAIADNDTARVRTLLAEGGIDFAARSRDGATILGYAITHAVETFAPPVAVEPVRLLLEAGAKPLPDLIEQGSEQGYAEHRLVTWIYGRGEQSVPVLDLVLGAGADPNARNYEGEPLLASSYTRLPMAEVLVRHGADVNAPDSSRTDRPGWSPVMVQALYQEWDIVAYLLDHGARADYVAGDGKTLADVLREADAGDEPRYVALRQRLGIE
ncbi:MAG: hypothetical protein IPK12_04535 [Gemmatimonadetes bacterium]|nr:hypothetical protein [Gemmatimonadota bacterium]